MNSMQDIERISRVGEEEQSEKETKLIRKLEVL